MLLLSNLGGSMLSLTEKPIYIEGISDVFIGRRFTPSLLNHEANHI